MQYKISQVPYNTDEPPSSSLSMESRINSYEGSPVSVREKELAIMKDKGIGYKMTERNRRDLFMERKSKPNPKVLEDIEKYKEKFKEEGVRRREEEEAREKRKLSQQRKGGQNSLELIQRNLSLGYMRLTPLIEGQIIFDFDTVREKQLKHTITFHQLY